MNVLVIVATSLLEKVPNLIHANSSAVIIISILHPSFVEKSNSLPVGLGKRSFPVKKVRPEKNISFF